MSNNSKPDRNRALLEARLSGKTYKECGLQFEISRARAQEICAKKGPSYARGVAKQMAEAGNPKLDIEAKLSQYAERGLLKPEKVRDTLRAALRQAGRVQDLALQSGFWIYGPNTMEEKMKAVQVRRPEGWEPVDATIFLHGVCGVFALALHHLLGYPIEVLLDDSEGEMWARLVHLYCPVEVREQQGYADVRGITTSWDGFLAEFADLSETWEHQKVDPDELREQLLAEMDNEAFCEFYGIAAALIREENWAYDGARME